MCSNCPSRLMLCALGGGAAGSYVLAPCRFFTFWVLVGFGRGALAGIRRMGCMRSGLLFPGSLSVGVPLAGLDPFESHGSLKAACSTRLSLSFWVW